MRKIISLSLGVALTATMFAAVPASADSEVVPRGGKCAVPGVVSGVDSRAEIAATFDAAGDFVWGTVKKSVANDNHAIIRCKGTDILNDFGRTKTVTGWLCMVPVLDENPDNPTGVRYIETTDSQVTVTKDGKATMKCKAAIDEVDEEE